MSLSDLLSTLTGSLSSASTSLPEAETLAPPPDGISLLDTKNELLLSYIQNLVFLIILKLRNQNTGPDTVSPEQASDEDVVKNLVSFRVYLERGVRPLESRLKYQLDKLLLAANDAESQSASKANGISNQKSNPTKKTNSNLSSASSSRSPSPQLPQATYPTFRTVLTRQPSFAPPPALHHQPLAPHPSTVLLKLPPPCLPPRPNRSVNLALHTLLTTMCAKSSMMRP